MRSGATLTGKVQGGAEAGGSEGRGQMQVVLARRPGRKGQEQPREAKMQDSAGVRSREGPGRQRGEKTQVQMPGAPEQAGRAGSRSRWRAWP